MEVPELLEHDLGHGLVDDLDAAPPLALLSMLSQRSGIKLDRLRCMSFAGWVSWLLDSLDDQIPDALETYVFQLSVLLPKLRRRTRSIMSWRAWLPSQPIHRACPLCLNDPANQAVLLAWKLPLMLSCPLHGCWLETYWGVPGRFLGWENADTAPRTASDAIAVMDQRTWQALTSGHVELPRRRIHAGLWFRLLRTLLDELNTPLSACGTYAGYLRQVWEGCGHPLRAGQSLWRPYETLNPTVRLQMLEAAATAISSIEVRDISPPGEQAKLFWPEPQTGFTSGLPAKAPKPEPVNHWQRAVQAIDEAIIEARHNPETARSLFALASYGRHDPASLEQLRATFMALLMGISDVGSIPVCDNRLAFLNDGVKRFSSLYESEMSFIANFISTLVWLVPKNANANNGSASFYELPHVTFIFDATLFFVPPFHKLLREFGFLGFVENLYHEALHHQVHTFNAFHGNQYCQGTLGESLIDFPQRQDRTFSYTQAFNVCYVYGEIVRYRRKVAQYLSEEYRVEELTWINEALDSAIMMRFNLATRLYPVRDAFLPPWKSLIEEWTLENDAGKYFNQEKQL